MAYTSCAADIAANIQENCSSPLVGGYTGRGFLIPLSYNPTFTYDAQNPRIITAITLQAGQKVCVIDNASMVTPLENSARQSDAEQGLRRYAKTVSFIIPKRGAGVAKDITEPLVDSAEGYVAVLEKKDRSGDGSFEMVGTMQGLKVNADGVAQSEFEREGGTLITMSCREAYSEVVLFDTDYATTKSYFDTFISTNAL